MNIPRFEAQISQIQVPTMTNYQEQENETIAKALSDFGSNLLRVSFRQYEEKEKQKKSQIEDLLIERRTLVKNKANTEHVDEMLKDLGVEV